jgi:3-methyladenine DNA glycosylase AlkD
VSTTLLAAVRSALAAAAEPARAPAMRAYMKSALPYHGVRVPAVRAICRQVFAGIELRSAAAWRREVLALWRGARFREERYAAIALTGERRARGFQTLAALRLYERMIVEGAWWDLVDDIATHRIGPMLHAPHGVAVRQEMLEWSRSPDIWKRRSAIICQVGAKRETDLPLLYACIEPSLGAPDFFLRKAIGWALRAYAWTDAREVARYVRARRRELSPLSKREALKNALRAGLIDAIP